MKFECSVKTVGKWMFTNTVILVDCPKCKQSKGFYCITPGGRKRPTPHCERVKLLPRDIVDLSRVEITKPSFIG